MGQSELLRSLRSIVSGCYSSCPRLAQKVGDLTGEIARHFVSQHEPPKAITQFFVHDTRRLSRLSSMILPTCLESRHSLRKQFKFRGRVLLIRFKTRDAFAYLCVAINQRLDCSFHFFAGHTSLRSKCLRLQAAIIREPRNERQARRACLSGSDATRNGLSLRRHRSDIQDRLELRKGRELFDGHAPNDHLRCLRIQNDLEAQFFESRESLRILVREPNLDLGLAVANEPRFVGERSEE